jgi:phage tail sheath protein FI
MPQYFSPGVYVEEKDPGPRPIVGVSTSIAGAVGVTLKGPTSGKPRLVTSFADFVTNFGGYLPEPSPDIVNDWAGSATEGGRWWQFAHSVEGFFLNGGQQLFVKRVFASAAAASSANLGGGLVIPLTADAKRGANTLVLEHLTGVADGGTFHLFRGDTQADLGPFTVQSYDPVRNRVTLSGATLPEDVEARRDFVEIHTRPAAPGPVTTANTVVAVSANARGGWGDAISVQIKPMVSATLGILSDPGEGAAVFSRVVVAATAGATTVTVRKVAGRLDAATAAPFTALIGGQRMAVSAIADNAGNVNWADLTVSALPADLAVGTTVQRLLAANPLLSRVTVAAVLGATTVTVRKVAGRLDTTTATPLTVLIDGQEMDVTAIADNGGDPNWADLTVAALPADVAVGATVRLPPGSVIFVSNASRLYQGAIVELDNGSQKDLTVVESVGGSLVTLRDNLRQAYLETDRLRLVEARALVHYAPTGEPAVDEEFSNLRLVRDGSPSTLIEVVSDRSAYVDLSVGAAYDEFDLAAFPTAINGAAQTLSGGDDRLADLRVDDFVGVDGGSGNRTGIAAMEDIDQVAICIAPGIWSHTVQAALIAHCELLKDRFAILDPRDGLGIEDVMAERELIDTKYAAMYYPWLIVRDPLVGRNVALAPSSHLAGIYARVDDERGVHKAPANEVIRAINGFQDDVTKREQDLLNPVGINALRFFPGRGFRVWGARVLTSDTLWRYVNVRRLFIMIRESIEEGTDFVVFEPNDPDLWVRVRLTITQFLETLRRSGALVGRTPAEAYFVRCDEKTMSPDDIDQGRLICEIGIAPSKPAEFVIFRIQQKTRELQPA